MRSLLFGIGIIVFAFGLLFMAQGSGFIPWPAESLMINETKWIYYGGGIAIVGLLLALYAR